MGIGFIHSRRRRRLKEFEREGNPEQQVFVQAVFFCQGLELAFWGFKFRGQLVEQGFEFEGELSLEGGLNAEIAHITWLCQDTQLLAHVLGVQYLGGIMFSKFCEVLLKAEFCNAFFQCVGGGIAEFGEFVQRAAVLEQAFVQDTALLLFKGQQQVMVTQNGADFLPG